MDIHHVINPHVSKRYFSEKLRISIALDFREHYLLSKYRQKSYISKEDLLLNELKCLEEFTDVPEHIIKDLKCNLKYSIKIEL